jgi:hypothetical protein
MVSDNGKTFEAAARVIQTVLADKNLCEHFSTLGVEWCFNLPKAPWWGGLFERLIRSTKRCLRKIIGQSRLSYDELLTAIVEVEMVLNSRPLTFVSAEDFEEPLTPSHLMVGRRLMSLPDPVYKGDGNEFVNYSKREQHLSRTLDQFWQRWRTEYLLELREAHRYGQGHSDATPVSMGDIVVIRTEGQPRGFWRLAKVEKTIRGRDGVTRGAVVRVANKKGKSTTLCRPVQHLFPLEVHQTPSLEQESHLDQEIVDPTTDELMQSTTPDDVPLQQPVATDESSDPPQRSRRAAFHRARDRIMAQAL